MDTRKLENAGKSVAETFRRLSVVLAGEVGDALTAQNAKIDAALHTERAETDARLNSLTDGVSRMVDEKLAAARREVQTVLDETAAAAEADRNAHRLKMRADTKAAVAAALADVDDKIANAARDTLAIVRAEVKNPRPKE